MPDLSNYRPPGVYVNDESLPYADPINAAFGEHLMCIVAPARGFQAAQETLTLDSAVPAVLSHPGVNQDTTFVVKTMGGITLQLNTDYVVSVDSSRPDAPVTSVKRLPTNASTVSPNGLANGEPVVISYTYTDASYWAPTVCNSFSDVVSKYGAPMSTQVGGDQITSPMSFAAQAAFENGATRIICVATRGTSNSSWQTSYSDAYKSIVAMQSVSVLVPIFPTSISSNAATLRSFLVDLRSHVVSAYTEGNGRLAIAGAGVGFDEKSNPFEQVAQAVSNKRVSVVYPTRMQAYNANTSQVIEVDGAYGAAAVAGRLMMSPVEQGVTRQVLNTVTGIPGAVSQKMTKSFMNNLSSSGVLVCMPNTSGRVVVRHGLTTDMTSLFTREISLVRIGDTLLQDIQIGMDAAGLIGSPIVPETTMRIQSILVGALEQEVANQVIVNYAGVTVSQRIYPGGDPSIIDCSFSYKPAAPLNYINVSFSLNMNIGVVAMADAGTAPDANLAGPNSTNSTLA